VDLARYFAPSGLLVAGRLAGSHAGWIGGHRRFINHSRCIFCAGPMAWPWKSSKVSRLWNGVWV